MNAYNKHFYIKNANDGILSVPTCENFLLKWLFLIKILFLRESSILFALVSTNVLNTTEKCYGSLIFRYSMYVSDIFVWNTYSQIVVTLNWKRPPESFQERLNSSIESSKQKYYFQKENKLNNTPKNLWSYWSLLKIFLNN